VARSPRRGEARIIGSDDVDAVRHDGHNDIYVINIYVDNIHVDNIHVDNIYVDKIYVITIRP